MSECDVPQLGWMRPPLLFAVALAIGGMLEWWMPIAVFDRGVATTLLGLAFILAAVALFAASAAQMRAAGTPIPARHPTTAIVRHGPYRFSRNPIYLAFALFQLGIALSFESAWLLATLAAAIALVDRVVVRREEAYLVRKFGAEYGAYQSATRRWL